MGQQRRIALICHSAGAEEAGENTFWQTTALVFGGELLNGGALGPFPSSSKSGSLEDHAFFGAAEHFEVAQHLLFRFFVELADAKTQVFVFLGYPVFFAPDNFILPRFQLQFVGKVFPVAAEFALGFKMGPGGEEKEQKTEAQAPCEWVSKEIRDVFHEGGGLGTR